MERVVQSPATAVHVSNAHVCVQQTDIKRQMQRKCAFARSSMTHRLLVIQRST
jgi:hypothetical protein